MKKSYIIGIVVIAVAVGTILATFSDSSTYASFGEAFSAQGQSFHVVGQLNKSRGIEYDPRNDANTCSFYMVDNKGLERRVILNKAKPQDFERSEQLVVIGKARGDVFIASDVLLKCPSKYDKGQPDSN